MVLAEGKMICLELAHFCNPKRQLQSHALSTVQKVYYCTCNGVAKLTLLGQYKYYLPN